MTERFTPDPLPAQYSAGTLGATLVRIARAIRAAYFYPVRTVTATVAASSTDGLIRANAADGAVSVTLPDPARCDTGVTVVVKKVDASANPVTVVGDIEGESSWDLTGQYHLLEVVNNGTSWDVLRSFAGPRLAL